MFKMSKKEIKVHSILIFISLIILFAMAIFITPTFETSNGIFIMDINFVLYVLKFIIIIFFWMFVVTTITFGFVSGMTSFFRK